MAEFLEDPSILTKDKLKSELTANNVPLPISDQKKNVYVQLYLKNLTVLNQKSPPTDMFSSDEELPAPVVSNNSISGRKATRKTDKPQSEGVEVTDLTDAGLKDELLKHGVNAGPIAAPASFMRRSFRSYWIQLPLRLPLAYLETATVTAAAAKADSIQNGNTLSDQYSDKEEDEITAAPEPEPVPVVEKPVMRRGKIPVTIRTSSRRSNMVVEESLATGDQTPKKTGENSHSECSSLGSEPARPGFLSVLLKLMVLITVAGSIYFVIQHLDADQVQSVKGLINNAKGPLCSTVDKVVDAMVDNVIVPLGIGAGSS
ncbi:unnamed protein product [Coregonus sp. 'balchen']|nr:unnamed protein product [Coregonus sp. 'balchen']